MSDFNIITHVNLRIMIFNSLFVIFSRVRIVECTASDMKFWALFISKLWGNKIIQTQKNVGYSF